MAFTRLRTAIWQLWPQSPRRQTSLRLMLDVRGFHPLTVFCKIKVDARAKMPDANSHKAITHIGAKQKGVKMLSSDKSSSKPEMKVQATSTHARSTLSSSEENMARILFKAYREWVAQGKPSRTTEEGTTIEHE